MGRIQIASHDFLFVISLRDCWEARCDLFFRKQSARKNVWGLPQILNLLLKNHTLGDKYMMLSKKVSLLAGAVALVGAIYMPQASATTYNIGSITNEDSTGAAATVLSAGSFSDWFKFTVTGGPAVFTGTGNSATTTSTIGTEIKTFDLYNASNVKIASASFSSAVVGKGNTYAAILSYAPLNAGEEYSINVKGTVLAGKGNYGLSLSTAPVPEPEEWAMMLVGAGMVGFQVRRKQKA